MLAAIASFFLWLERDLTIDVALISQRVSNYQLSTILYNINFTHQNFVKTQANAWSDFFSFTIPFYQWSRIQAFRYLITEVTIKIMFRESKTGICIET